MLIRQPKCPHCSFDLIGNLPFCERCKFDIDYGLLVKKGNCIYCKSHKTTDEHIFGDWLSKRYNWLATDSTRILARPEQPSIKSIIHIHKYKGKQTRRAYQEKTRSVCAPCNNGWLSEIHKKNQQILIKLVENENLNIRDCEFSSLAHWIFMVAINCQYAGRIITTTEKQRHEFSKNQLPEGCLEISYLRTTDNFPTVQRSLSMNVIEGNNIVAKRGIVYFFVENIAFLIITSTSADDFKSFSSTVSELQHLSKFRKIWPIIEDKPLWGDLNWNYVHEFTNVIMGTIIE